MTLLFAILPAIAALLPGTLGIALVHYWDQKQQASDKNSHQTTASSKARPETTPPRQLALSPRPNASWIYQA